ncbi:MAG: sxtJ [Gammaproteobacteria bacterium]|nr:sxtJ [Gammaproteobacteria bacterium]
MMHTIPELDRKGLRNFGFTMAGAIIVIFALLLPWLLEVPIPRWPWIAGSVLVACGLIVPAVLRPVYRGWMHFGLFMSKLTTPLILGIVFFGVLLPMALVMKLISRDPMARKLDKEMPSYRVTSHKAPKENLEKPF